MDEPTHSPAYDYLLRTPSPKGRRQAGSTQSPCTLSDRMIPSRVATDFTCGLNLLEVKENFVPSNFESPRGARNTSVASEHGTPAQLYDQMLQSELLGKPTPPRRDDDTLKLATPESNQNLFQYKSVLEEVPRWFDECESTKSPVPYLSSPDHSGYQKPPCRKIQRTPVRVMDAPDMQDDFYCNLIDWSSTDDLAVALGSSVYCWNAGNNRVAKLCDLGSSAVTSVRGPENLAGACQVACGQLRTTLLGRYATPSLNAPQCQSSRLSGIRTTYTIRLFSSFIWTTVLPPASRHLAHPMGVHTCY